MFCAELAESTVTTWPPRRTLTFHGAPSRTHTRGANRSAAPFASVPSYSTGPLATPRRTSSQQSPFVARTTSGELCGPAAGCSDSATRGCASAAGAGAAGGVSAVSFGADDIVLQATAAAT